MPRIDFGMDVLPVVRVELELTEACNLHCRFCYHSRAPRHNRHVPLLLRRLEEAGVMEVVLTGGEPGLAPDFSATLADACARFPRVMVQSNGTLFAQADSFARLARERLFCCNFSLHGPKSAHDAATGVPGSFEAASAAIRRAAAARMRVASNLVLHCGNAEPALLEESVAHLAGLGCKEMTMTRFIPVGLGAGQPLGVTPEAFLACVRAARAACAAHGLSFLLANALPACETPADLRSLCNRCSFGYDRLYVDVDGNVLVCGMNRTVLGNILETPLADVLSQAKTYRQYIELRHLPTKCRHCGDLEICGGGCRAAALARTGRPDGEDRL